MVAFTPPRMVMRLNSQRSGQLLHLTSLRSPEGLAVLNNSDYSFLTEEARFIRAIRACNTSEGVEAVLDRAMDHMSPNIAATATRTMIKFDRKSETTSKALPFLLNVAESGVVAYTLNDTKSMTLYAMQDVLYSLSLLRETSMLPLANSICDIMASDLTATLDKLEPRRLIEIMEAAHSLSLGGNQSALLDSIARRLAKSDAVGKLAPSKVCEGLMPLASFPDALRIFLRRLRKSSVRQELSPHFITVAIRAAGKLREMDHALLQDIQIMAYTLVNRELSRSMLDNTTTLVYQLSSYQAATILYAISKFEWPELPVIQDLCRVIAESQHVTPMDVALTLQSMTKLKIDNPDLAKHLGTQLMRWVKDGCPIERRQMNVILTSVVRLYKDNPSLVRKYEIALTELLRGNTCESTVQSNISEFDIAMYVWFLSEYGIERDLEIGSRLGKILLSIATTQEVNPAAFVMTVRYAVKMYARLDNGVLDAYLEAAKQTCRGDWLLLMSSLDLSFLTEALTIGRCTDEALFLRLGEAITRPSLVDACSPSSARRIMSSFAITASRIPTARLQTCQQKIFDRLGAILLTTQLMPYEAAEAAFSYAKSGYASDMGVFDHVTNLVSRSLPSLSTRQVAKCLWACGKMYVWEPQMSPEIQGPPYLSSARKYAKHLSTRESELSAKDLAQCLWAMGRLAISDRTTTTALASRVQKVLPDCFACETSNIIWGLSKTGFDDKDMMVGISRRMLDADVHASPEEAACVLYALGNAGIREDDVFEHLTDSMMSQVECVGAQAMANALWAHNVVGKLPPPALLQSWASDKLGLTGFLPFMPELDSQE